MRHVIEIMRVETNDKIEIVSERQGSYILRYKGRLFNHINHYKRNKRKVYNNFVMNYFCDALNKAERLNKVFNCNDFTVHELS